MYCYERNFWSAERGCFCRKNLFLQKQLLSVVSVFLQKGFVKHFLSLLSALQKETNSLSVDLYLELVLAISITYISE